MYLSKKDQHTNVNTVSVTILIQRFKRLCVFYIRVLPVNNSLLPTIMEYILEITYISEQFHSNHSYSM